MIIEWLMRWIGAGAAFPATLLPSAGQDPTTGWGGVVAHMADLNYYLPISETFAFVVGVIVVFPALAGISMVVWIMAYLRGGSARG